MKLPHWLRCRWGKWHTYQYEYTSQYFRLGREVGGPFEQVEVRQRRQCLDCHKVQDRLVRRPGAPDPAGISEQLARERVATVR